MEQNQELYIQRDCHGIWWSCPPKLHQISDIQRNNQVFSLSLYVEYFIKTLCWLKIGADLYLLKSGTRREEKAIKVINLQDIHNSQGSFPWGRIALQWWDLPCHLLKLLLREFLKVRGNGLKTWKFTHLQNTMLGHVQIKFLETEWGKSIIKVYEDSSMPFHRLKRQIKIIVKEKKEGDGGEIILPMPLDTINSKTGNISRSPTWQSPAPIDHSCSSQTFSFAVIIQDEQYHCNPLPISVRNLSEICQQALHTYLLVNYYLYKNKYLLKFSNLK